MTAAEILNALNTVERDHQLVLHKIQTFKDAVTCLLDPAGTDPRPVLQRLRQGVNFFTTEFSDHCFEEEANLFPILEQQPGGDTLVAELRKQHVVLKDKCQELSTCLDVAGELEDHVPRAVLRDVVTYGWQLWELLDQHAHTETSAVHKCIAQTMANSMP